MFAGESNGWFKAYDAKNGNVLWKFQAGAGVNAPPSSYTVGGKQYVVVALAATCRSIPSAATASSPLRFGLSGTSSLRDRLDDREDGTGNGPVVFVWGTLDRMRILSILLALALTMPLAARTSKASRKRRRSARPATARRAFRWRQPFPSSGASSSAIFICSFATSRAGARKNEQMAPILEPLQRDDLWLWQIFFAKTVAQPASSRTRQRPSRRRRRAPIPRSAAPAAIRMATRAEVLSRALPARARITSPRR